MSDRFVHTLALRALAAGGASVAAACVLISTPSSGYATSDDAFRLLAQCASASHSLNYSGTQLVTIYGQPETLSVVADIKHLAGSGTSLHIQATPKMAAHDVFEPDAVEDTWIGTGGSLAGGGLGSTSLALLREHFSASTAGTTSVAGRKADIVELKDSSGHVAARFWLDDTTSLPLRREIYDDKGQLARLTGYLDFTIDPISKAGFSSPVGNRMIPASGTVMTTSDIALARAQGWSFPNELGSMQLVEIRRGASDDRAPISSSEVMHLVYSDGLSTVSVFQQPGRLSAPKGWTEQTMAHRKVWVSGGVPSAISWSAKGKVYTVVADAGAPHIESVIAGLPHSKVQRGFLHRMHHGLDRVGSWLNPFS